MRTLQNYGFWPLGLLHLVETVWQQSKMIRIQGTHLSAKRPQRSGQTLELTNKGTCNTSMLQGSSVRMPFLILLWNPTSQCLTAGWLHLLIRICLQHELDYTKAFPPKFPHCPWFDQFINTIIIMIHLHLHGICAAVPPTCEVYNLPTTSTSSCPFARNVAQCTPHSGHRNAARFFLTFQHSFSNNHS